MKLLPSFALLFLTASLSLGDAPKKVATVTPPDLPLPVASFGAAATPEGSVYIYGGHSGAKHQYHRDDVHGDLYHWEAGQSGWEKLSTSEAAQGASLLITDQGVLRIGGMAARNAKGEKQDLWSSDTAEIFDVKEKKWKALPKLPAPRSSHDSALLGQTVYVVGGWSMTGGRKSDWHETYLTLDLSKTDAKWESHKQPFARRALAVQAVGEKLYVIGGMDSDHEMSSAVEILDAKTGEWSKGGDLPKDKLGGFGFSAIAHEGRLFASGAPGILLEWRDNAWTPITKLEHARYFHRLVPGGAGKLFAIGGESKEGKKTPSETITLPAKDSPALSVATKP